MRTLKKSLALVLALVMVFSLAVSASAAYTDAEEIEYAEAVELLSALGVIEGYPDGSFGPTKTLNRAEAAIIVARLNAYTDTTAVTPTYTDMAGYNWANWAVAYAENAGIVNGTAEGIYEPATELTGYMWLKMLLVSIGYNAVDNGMTGAAWQIGVAKLNSVLNLTAGIEDIDLSAPISREEAAQCAFNALMTVRDGATWAVWHQGHVHYFATEEEALLFAAADLANCSVPFTGNHITTLGFEKFGLIGWGMGQNAWGQPYYGWKLADGSALCVEWVPASVTYTTAQDDDTIFADCVAAGIAYAEFDTTEDYVPFEEVWVNGVNTGSDGAYKGWDFYNTYYTGNGTMTYIYDTVYGVIVVAIEQFIGQVTSEVAAVETTGADAYVVITNYCDDDDEQNTWTIFNSDLKLGEVVVYNECAGAICNIHTPNTVSGTVLRVDLKNTDVENDDVYNISGEDTLVSRHDNLVIAGGDTATWYVDDCGNLMMKAADIPFTYEVGVLLSYDVQNRWDGDKNHTCESYEASEVFEIYNIATGETVLYNGALTATAATTTFSTGVTVANEGGAYAADYLDLVGTNYTVDNAAGLSLGLVVYLTNEDGEIYYISDTASGNGALQIKTTESWGLVVDTMDVNLYYDKGETVDATGRYMNDSTEYVYATLETAHEITSVATGIKNAQTLTAAGEYVWNVATNEVVAIAQYVPAEVEDDTVAPVVEDVLVYVGADYTVTSREYYEVDALGNKVGPYTEWIVTGLYVDGVALDPITFDADPIEFFRGNLYDVTITTDSEGEHWVINDVVATSSDVIVYVGTGAAGDYFLTAGNYQYHMAADANIVCVNAADQIVAVNGSVTELDISYGRCVIEYVVVNDDGLVTDLYYWYATDLTVEEDVEEDVEPEA